MRNSLIVLFVVFCNFCNAQSTVDSLKVKSKKFFVGVNFSPSYCYRTLETNTSDSYKIIVKFRNEDEKPRFGYSFGVNSFIKINRYLEFGYGIQNSVEGYQYKIDYKSLTFGEMIDPRYGFVYNTDSMALGINEIIYRYTYKYLEIPLKIGVRFGYKKLKYFADAGLAFSYLYKYSNNVVTKYENGDIDRNSVDYRYFENVNKFGVFGIASVGVSFDLTKRLFIQGTPTFRYGFIETHDSQINEHLWSAGFNCSLYYNLISSKK